MSDGEFSFITWMVPDMKIERVYLVTALFVACALMGWATGMKKNNVEALEGKFSSLDDIDYFEKGSHFVDRELGNSFFFPDYFDQIDGAVLKQKQGFVEMDEVGSFPDILAVFITGKTRVVIVQTENSEPVKLKIGQETAKGWKIQYIDLTIVIATKKGIERVFPVPLYKLDKELRNHEEN